MRRLRGAREEQAACAPVVPQHYTELRTGRVRVARPGCRHSPLQSKRDCRWEQPPAGAANTHSNPVRWRGGCTSLFGCWLYSCVSSGTLMGPSFFGHPPPCKQNPFSSLYSDVPLYLQQQQALTHESGYILGMRVGGRGGGVCTSRCGRGTRSCVRDGAQRGAAAAARCCPWTSG